MIRWLVVGAGQAGRCHMAAIARAPNAMLAGLVDPKPANDLTHLPCFVDLASAIAAAKPNAVVIAAPNDTHVDLARAAIDAGLPVLCEKPVGRTAADAEAIAAYGVERGVPVGIVLNQRALAATRWIKDLIASGKLSPRSISFTGDVTRLGSWHVDVARSGGGALRTIGIHYLDLLVWWLGKPLSFTANLMGEPAESAFKVTLQFTNGCVGSVEIAATREVGTGPVRCVIESGEARATMEGHRIIEASGVPPTPEPEPLDPALSYGPGHATLTAEATASLNAGREFQIPLRAAIPTLRLVDSIYDQAGRAVPRI
ncbi:MAG: Gfo/Idh/MocA family oxidoreductase [Rhodospirillaceae bacterium]|nr:Gfo/Idh/MocA family oxidoreductase [Rhodospirillaceae bacterium]